MKRITVTIARKGLPRQRFTGIFASTSAAVMFALDMAGDVPCSISAKVHP